MTDHAEIRKTDIFRCAPQPPECTRKYEVSHCPDEARDGSYETGWTRAIATKSGHILVRTHVRETGRILRNSGDMSGVLESERIDPDGCCRGDSVLCARQDRGRSRRSATNREEAILMTAVSVNIFAYATSLHQQVKTRGARERHDRTVLSSGPIGLELTMPVYMTCTRTLAAGTKRL